ncbi:molybdopterin converting factor subunit 1 [Bacillus mojavensis]|jgi:molybdopterin converting factor subunit 1|uniref:Molybdopterin synthase sulfur carrier subunit n=1 Tax=Bacillus mojavensis TaxID=72360 RepID=A0AAP3FX88_BACMO|nr:molybdopterin converting factor subunit 1 [Bacillus mojavensis]MCY8103691.1 molybdopterin converting factor subunit 1 [Bacillus mojavensis]MCY8481141.1 molybdopterin converting factor subunit 1 [Bacillus mojavensis]MCY8510069.1 molybdopterin converting factor subunit 1 [Bacillus mojavensis]MCY9092335.1 molybdopterin converting factor subunit 1 [Bacillus mojavensis]MCY9190333.1 molybdopterin converting factor subunit 1 [Bacillus mojavensis]
MIKILLFAGLAEKAGTSTLEIDMEQATTDDVKAVLKEQYGLESIDTAMIAVNESYVKENTSVSSGDTVAVIPPVSGG